MEEIHGGKMRPPGNRGNGAFNMDVLRIFFLFLILCVASFYGCKQAAQNMLKQADCYSEKAKDRCVTPNRMIRQIFKLKKNWIPKYIECELFISLGFLCLFPLYIGLCFVYTSPEQMVSLMISVHLVLTFVDIVWFLIASSQYKRLSRKG